jgi:hypothetical protein
MSAPYAVALVASTPLLHTSDRAYLYLIIVYLYTITSNGMKNCAHQWEVKDRVASAVKRDNMERSREERREGGDVDTGP